MVHAATHSQGMWRVDQGRKQSLLFNRLKRSRLAIRFQRLGGIAASLVKMLTMVKMMPRPWRLATAAWARGVNCLSSVINVPSTSEMTAEIFVGGDRGGVMAIFRRLDR